ncbi:MAG: CsgG/HfaB family protein [Bacteroidetes bacterium]|jgi:TolB-like protein|nr:CsgG/HfaB family protein [Bacteroidota bacterium]
MRTRCYSLLPLVLLLIGCGGSKPQIAKPKINISIMDFEARAGVQAPEAQSVGDALASLLTQTARFNVVDRKQIQAVLQEQSFQAAQNPNAGLGQAASVLAVRKFVTGSLGKLGENYIFSVKITDVETSGIDLSISRTYDDDLEDIMDEFLPEIVSEIVAAVDGVQKK